eukprot:2173066-Amphidinium_carterae.1
MSYVTQTLKMPSSLMARHGARLPDHHMRTLVLPCSVWQDSDVRCEGGRIRPLWVLLFRSRG